MTDPAPGTNQPPVPPATPEGSPADASAPPPGWNVQPSGAGGGATAGAPGGATAAAAQAQATSMLARMSRPEQLAVVGAVLLLLVEVVTGLLLDQYYAGDLVSLLAIAILVGAWVQYGRGGTVPLGYITVIKIAGFAIGLIAISDLIVELRRGVFDNVTDIIGGLAYYVGAALVAVGAFQAKER